MDALRDQPGTALVRRPRARSPARRAGRCGGVRPSPPWPCSRSPSASAPIPPCSASLDGILLKPLPYPDRPTNWSPSGTPRQGAEGLASVSGRSAPLGLDALLTYAEQNRTFSHIGIWFPFSATVTGVAEPEQVRTVVVSDGVLQALDVPPLLGRPAGRSRPGARRRGDRAARLRLLAAALRRRRANRTDA